MDSSRARVGGLHAAKARRVTDKAKKEASQPSPPQGGLATCELQSLWEALRQSPFGPTPA
jgi:hypothetical protein